MSIVVRSSFVASAVVAVTFALAACSSSSSNNNGGGNDGGGAVDPARACNDLASATCNKLQACAPNFIATSFGSVAACTSRGAASCVKALAAKGTSATPAHHEACSQAIGTESCDDVFNGNTPSACAIAPGTLADGAACGDDAQCTSAFCGNKAAGKYCGTCATAPAAGAACNGGRCGPGLACAANATCVKPGGAGATCDATATCQTTLSCGSLVASDAGASGKCATPVALGQTCDPRQSTTPGCVATAGDYCNVVTNVCEAVTIASTGELCGSVRAKLTVCGALGFCRIPANTAQGSCIAAAADGAACDDAKGPLCMAGSRCVNAVCTPDDPATCL